MLGTKALEAKMMDLLAADVSTLAEVLLIEMILFVNNVTLTPNTVVGDLTPASFDGYAPLKCGALPHHVFIDPNTGDNMVEITPPAGGWYFETTGVTSLPQTVYGFAITNAAGTVLLASEPLQSPIPITISGQGFSMPPAVLRLPLGSV